MRLLPSFRAQQLVLDFASLENSCPEGIYLSLSPNDPSRWTGVFFVRSGPYEPSILRFEISFPPAYPSQSPLIIFSSDIFHPLCVPSTVYTFSTGSLDAVGTVSASDEERLPPGSFSLRYAFPGWFGRQDSRRSNFDADASGSEPGLLDSRGTTLKVLQHLKEAFEDTRLLDSLPLEAERAAELEMEYFNFEDASHVIPPLDLDNPSSLQAPIHQDNADDSFGSFFPNKPQEQPPFDPALPAPAPGPMKLKLMNNIEIEVIPQPDDANLDYPMFRAKEPYCSFTHPKIPKGYVSTFPGISEDRVWTDFSREQRKSLKSFDEARGRKAGARFPRDAVKILKQWLAEHSDHPYPNEREKDELKQLTGLKRKHNFGACHDKTLQERTFYRKDHLRQHLKLMHGCKYESHMEGWKSTTNEIKSSCGFCPSRFTTWSQRADHLAAHFRNGADMGTWVNGWGFEPHIERRVENAIPPYLIGHERRTMEPYVARFLNDGQTSATARGNRNSIGKANTPSSGSNSGLTRGLSVDDSDLDGDYDIGELDQMTKDSNCWGRLEQELGKFVAQHKLGGTIPSNHQIQDAARMIIYEDDDPWNWTCADNAQWLDTFKYQQGIGGLTQSMGITSPGPNGSADLRLPGETGSSTAWTKTLAEVPVLPPYVIPGGNKQAGGKGKSNANVSTTSATSGKQGGGASGAGMKRCTPHNQDTHINLFNHGPNNTSNDMDLDFEGIDFSALDLGMIGDGELGLGTPGTWIEHGHGHPIAMANTSGAEGYAPISTQVQDFAGDFGMEHDMGVGLDLGVASEMQPGLGTTTNVYMSQEELAQLANYSSGFASPRS
ncbi:hypothetical protein DV737_g4451, partial [Chaetothyriales sp. CBS 132003]